MHHASHQRPGGSRQGGAFPVGVVAGSASGAATNAAVVVAAAVRFASWRATGGSWAAPSRKRSAFRADSRPGETAAPSADGSPSGVVRSMSPSSPLAVASPDAASATASPSSSLSRRFSWYQTVTGSRTFGPMTLRTKPLSVMRSPSWCIRDCPMAGHATHRARTAHLRAGRQERRPPRPSRAVRHPPRAACGVVAASPGPSSARSDAGSIPAAADPGSGGSLDPPWAPAGVGVSARRRGAPRPPWCSLGWSADVGAGGCSGSSAAPAGRQHQVEQRVELGARLGDPGSASERIDGQALCCGLADSGPQPHGRAWRRVDRISDPRRPVAVVAGTDPTC